MSKIVNAHMPHHENIGREYCWECAAPLPFGQSILCNNCRNNCPQQPSIQAIYDARNGREYCWECAAPLPFGQSILCNNCPQQPSIQAIYDARDGAPDPLLTYRLHVVESVEVEEGTEEPEPDWSCESCGAPNGYPICGPCERYNAGYTYL
jgi:hypothetical protein